MDSPYYPERYTSAAYRLGINYITYSNSAEKIYNRILISELESQLPEKELEIVRLYEFHGLDWREIATLKNITPETARKRYYRSVKTIRKVLRIQTEDGGTKPKHA